MAERFFIQTLGCAKNTADSDGIQAVLARAGLEPAAEAEQADVMIVNTCGFLQASRAESLDALRALGENKREDQLLIAAGCLISRYGEAVKREVPQVDGVIDAGKWIAMPRLIEYLRTHGTNGRGEKVGSAANWFDEAYLNLSRDQLSARSVTDHLPRFVSGPSAFLKIADGCDRPCTFCIIPAIKGAHRSKPMDDVVAEVRELVAQGAVEIVLVAQDTTAYGWDWGQRDQLSVLLKRLCEEVAGLHWLRLMYAYPGHVTPRLIETMAAYPQIVHYLDVPLQHADEQVLHRMRRPNPITARRMLDSLREAMPDIAIRTTFIVGFPGETPEEFQSLLGFLQEQQFDRVGVFEYSSEEGTPAALLDKQIKPKVKARRRHEAMMLQQQISLARQQQWVGRTLDVLIEGLGEIQDEKMQPGKSKGKTAALGGQVVSIGRSYRDAPEVDGLVIVEGELATGMLAQVRITGASEYDLYGIPVAQDQ